MLPVIEIALPAQPGGSVPAFLAKLWKMVDNPETNSLINWSPDGSSFVIRNQGRNENRNPAILNFKYLTLSL